MFEYSSPLLIVVGKGGVGKSVAAAALGLKAVRQGRSTLLVETAGTASLPGLLGHTDRVPERSGDPDPVTLEDGLAWCTPTPDRLLAAWLASKNLGLVSRRLERSGALSVVASSVPGIRDVLLLGFLRSQLERGRWDQIILDGPASGRAIEMLRAPGQLLAISNDGPIFDQARRADELLTDPSRCSVVMVTVAEETPVKETIETSFAIEDSPGVHLSAVFMNRLLPSEPNDTIASEAQMGHLHTRVERETLYTTKLQRELPVPFVRIGEYPGGITDRPGLESVWKNLDGEPSAHSSDAPATVDPFVSAPFDKRPNARILVTVGTGGVGKTSVSAALAARAAASGQHVALITIDPARRLADALGLTDLGDDLREVSLPESHTGSLRACMLEPGQTFERIIQIHARDASQVDAIMGTRISHQLTRSLSGMTEYCAVERLYELIEDPSIDLVVLDTPPSSDAIAFLQAPDGLARLFENQMYKVLTGKAGSIVTSALRRLVNQLVGILGRSIVSDAIDFFQAIEGMEEGLMERGRHVQHILSTSAASFIVVTTPWGRSPDEAIRFVAQLRAAGVTPEAVIANRCTPHPGELASATTSPAVTHLLRANSVETGRLHRLVDSLEIPVHRVESLEQPISDLDAVIELSSKI